LDENLYPPVLGGNGQRAGLSLAYAGPRPGHSLVRVDVPAHDQAGQAVQNLLGAPRSEVQVVFNGSHLVGVAHGANAERGPAGCRFPTVDDLLGELVDLVLVGPLQVRSAEVEVVEDEVGQRSGPIDLGFSTDKSGEVIGNGFAFAQHFPVGLVRFWSTGHFGLAVGFAFPVRLTGYFEQDSIDVVHQRFLSDRGRLCAST
jgi:hypothetical protein